jgi:predicted PurR-regulated permease PerM
MVNTSMKNLSPTALGIAAFVIILAGMKQAQSFLTPFLMALFIAIICAQPILWLKKKNVSSGLAVLIVIVGLLAVYTGLNWLVGSSLSLFIRDASKYSENLKELTESAGGFFSKRGINIAVFGGAGSMDPAKVMEHTRTVVSHIREMVSNEITFLFLTLFLLAEVEAIRLKIRAILKGNDADFEYWRTIGKKIRHYLSIKTMTSLATGLLVGSSLAIIGVDYPVLWGLVAFLLNYIPTIGSIIAAIPGVTFSLLQLGFPATYWTIGIYLFANVVIGSVLEPRIMGKGMGLSTFTVFFGLIFWGFILGPVGMFLSVPFTMSIKFILDYNPKTRWIAVLLGTRHDALRELEGLDRQQ